jgi:hypothetical protein
VGRYLEKRGARTEERFFGDEKKIISRKMLKKYLDIICLFLIKHTPLRLRRPSPVKR